MRKLEKIAVKDTIRQDDDHPILLKLTDDFSQVIKNFAQHVEIKGIFVVDEDDRFLGVITRTDMLDWARAKLGTILYKPLTDMNETIRLVTLIGASKVGDILRPETKNAAVNQNDTLGEALKIMVDIDLIVLPVVNESLHVIGRLRLSEILDRALTE
ncbi:MAG: HPP family protein [Anaerolineales bacterium]|jgi:predicted transcriptional regulator